MALKQLSYKITLLSPVLITSTVGDENISMSEDYLSGTSLLGMFARGYIKKKNLQNAAHENDKFKKWFLSDALRFLNGYITSHAGLRSLPIPMSVQFTKGGATDTSKAPPFECLFHDPESETTHKDGFCVLNSNGIEIVSPNKQHHFHHERTNQLIGRSEDALIFNYECLLPFQTFAALVVGTENELDAFLKEFGDKPFTARLGRSKNTEYGHVQIQFDTETHDVDELHEKAEIDLEDTDGEFTLTCLSHMLLVDEWGESAVSNTILIESVEREILRYLRQITGESARELPANFLTIEKSYLRSVDIENYVSVWKARKPSVSAFRMGSCFRIKVNSNVDAGIFSHLPDLLRRLQQEGIGLRRNEGFGRIAINWQQDAGHNGRITNVTEKRREIRKKTASSPPDGSPPPLARQILRDAYYAHLLRRAGEKAVERLEQFRNLPPGSQISRLQAIAETAADERDFIKKVGFLQRTARDKLARCENRNRAETLLDFFENLSLTKQSTDNNAGNSSRQQQTPELQDLISPPAGTAESEFCRALGLRPEQDTSLQNALYKEYMSVFFALMQKKKKIEGSRS